MKEIDKSPESWNTQCFISNKSATQMINRKEEYFNIVSQIDPKDNYRTFFPTTLENMFLYHEYETPLG